MTTLKPLLARNRSWALQKCQHDPDYFEKWIDGQRPHSLWIGCSDSRVPSEVLTGSQPGELFVHRNIANMLDPADDNVMSVLQYALHYLEVERVVLCGHYGCGGVQAALSLPTLPLAQESSALARRIGQLRHTLHHELRRSPMTVVLRPPPAPAPAPAPAPTRSVLAMRWTPWWKPTFAPSSPVCWRVSRCRRCSPAGGRSACTAASTIWLPAI
ncbi:carbonic anhydrase [Klebsiella pneumoniae]|uniref:Carbonic anhydrase n=1 Tax=Klebsiella pneumoniae TaxID=573 RepID=A0A378FTL6_KLEPN|nr:carbonic anhydrase [Klebsiella pneumoniae]